MPFIISILSGCLDCISFSFVLIKFERSSTLSLKPGSHKIFNASSAVALEARGEPSILVRIETTPDDIRGMHSANGILTERGGINSHAAVVARTLGLPCVVGVSNINIDQKNKKLHLVFYLNNNHLNINFFY